MSINLGNHVSAPFLIALLLVMMCGTTLSLCAQSYAGVAQTNITPPVGYAHYRGVSTGVHDSLYAKAIVLGKGVNRFAWVVCDLLWIERELSSTVRLKASQRLGIPYDHLVISATHTHTSPAYHGNISELNENLRVAEHQDPPMDDGGDYTGWLIEQIVQAIATADRSAVPVTFETGCEEVNGLAFNRRSILGDGNVQMNAGAGNPAIIGPAGPVDNYIEIVLIRRVSDGKAIGCMSSFGVHSDTFGGTEFSADYPGFLATSLRKTFGDDFVSIFGLGACGDINHIDVRSKEKRLTTAQIGEELADVIKRSVPTLHKERPLLNGKSAYVYVPLQDYSEQELAWALAEKPDSLYHEKPFLTRRRAVKIRSLYRMRQTGEAIPPTIGSLPWTLPLHVQVMQISDSTAIVGLPGELFATLGMAIKKQSPFRTTLVIELTNSHIAYVPNSEAFAQGSYETINSRLAPGGGETMVDTAVRLLHELAGGNQKAARRLTKTMMQ